MRSATTIFLALAALSLAPLAFPARAAEEKPDPKMPKEREYSYIWDLLDNSVARPIARQLDAARLIRRIGNAPREAANVDADDQVRMPSTWWTPRAGFRPVPVEQMLKGPGDGSGPATGRWTVTKAKTQGVTPGFQIKDAKGRRFIVKFDAPNFPELASGADVVGTYLFWAAGYNTPDNTICYFRAESLDIDPEATFKDAIGNEKKFDQKHLDGLLQRVARRPDGSYRALASLFVKGKPLGPFEYQGRRKDDPEDLIPHELRRELRGMWAMAAFTNHADIRGPNSLDAWVEEGGRSFVRHYLIDFGSILGSSAIGARSPVTGTEYYVDYNVMARQFLTLGLAPFDWEDTVDPELKSVGFVEAAEFDPVHWRPDYPNPAFDDRTDRDVRWGVRIVSGITDAHIRAAVAAAKYSDPRAAEYLTQVLIQRRDKLVRTWLGGDAEARTASQR